MAAETAYMSQFHVITNDIAVITIRIYPDWFPRHGQAEKRALDAY